MTACTYCTNERNDARGRHRTRLSAGTVRRMSTTALAVLLAASIGAGAAHADPEQGGTSPDNPGPSQGGTTPDSPGPSQGGTTPTPKPTPQPNWDGGGNSWVPAPPQEAPPVYYTPPPTYDTPYTPVPIAPITVRPSAPVNPIKPPPGKIRIGNFITDIPPGMSDRDVRSLNQWAAFGEAKVAQGLISIGVPKDQATRQAAATIIGVALGGAAGATAVAIPAATIGLVIGAPIGAVVGGVIGAVGIVPVTAALTPILGPAAATVGPIVSVGGGIAVGTVAGGVIGAGLLGTAGAVIGAALGGTIGGGVAFALGAGDPGADPGSPSDPGERENDPGYTLPVPNAGADQYVLVLNNKDSRLPGGPAARYVVKKSGDVEGSVTINNVTVPFAWTAQQADAPFQQLGFISQTARDAATATAYRWGRQAIGQIPGLQISFPQSVLPGQTAPTDGTLGEAERERQARLNRARAKARESAKSPAPAPVGAPAPTVTQVTPHAPRQSTLQAPAAPEKPVTAPQWTPPKAAAIVPKNAPREVKRGAAQLDSFVAGLRR